MANGIKLNAKLNAKLGESVGPVLVSDDILVASGIEKASHLTVFDKLASLRFAALEVEKVLVYLIETVDVDALLSLAEQFDLLGYKGWRLATSERERRDLIKRAIELHRYKGTPFAIKQAIRSLGYPDVGIEEHIANLYNGKIRYDGSNTYGSGTWATFRVVFDLGNDKGVTQSQTDELVALIQEYKNARSRLVGLSYVANMTDVLDSTPTDSITITVQVFGQSDRIQNGLFYNGAANYDNTNTHRTYQDDIQITG
jgi:P2-related tail formation protein